MADVIWNLAVADPFFDRPPFILLFLSPIQQTLSIYPRVRNFPSKMAFLHYFKVLPFQLIFKEVCRLVGKTCYVDRYKGTKERYNFETQDYQDETCSSATAVATAAAR